MKKIDMLLECKVSHKHLPIALDIYMYMYTHILLSNTTSDWIMAFAILSIFKSDVAVILK